MSDRKLSATPNQAFHITQTDISCSFPLLSDQQATVAKPTRQKPGGAAYALGAVHQRRVFPDVR